MKIKLQEILDSKNISVYSLSKQIGVTQNNLGKLIKGETTSIKYDILEKLCNILDITPNDIFEVEPSTDIEIKTYKILNKIKDEKITPYYDYNPNIRLSDLENIKPQTNKTSQPDFQTIDSEGKVNLYQIKSSQSETNERYRLSGRQALKNAEQFEKEHGYNPIPNDEELFEIEQIQERLELEYTLEENLELIINSIISNSDLSVLPIRIKKEIEAYSEQKVTSFQFKFILAYRSLYALIVKQVNNKHIIDFISKIIKIYNNGGLYEMNNDDLDSLILESENLLEIYKKD